jgi:hypothetical protein
MPNGNDKDWHRLLAAVEGFRLRHDGWPTRVRVFDSTLDTFRNHLFSPEAFERLSRTLAIVADGSPMVAEDDDGRTYSYGAEGGPDVPTEPRAAAWLAVEPDRMDPLGW